MLQLEERAGTRVDGPILDVEKLHSAKLETHPFDYLIVSDFIRPAWQDRLIADHILFTGRSRIFFLHVDPKSENLLLTNILLNDH